MRLGLALSGGGLRATLYHLGVVRYLRDSGLLENVSHITSVSGGSILAAHLVLNWERYLSSPEDFDRAAQEIVDFVRLDVRNRIIRRYPFALAYGSAQRLVRHRPSRNLTRTGLLEVHYRDFLFGDTCLHQLPNHPELHILCTNLSEGRLSSFSRDGLLFEERTGTATMEMKEHRAGLATIPMAVAASSAFPGFFPPLELTFDDIGASEGEFQTQFFTDGGVYDNLGVRMFKYLSQKQKTSLSLEDISDIDAAISAWNQAARSNELTPLNRVIEIHRLVQSMPSTTNRVQGEISDPRQLIEELQLIINKTALAEDGLLLGMLGKFGEIKSCPTDRNQRDRFSMNRQLLSLAFEDETGQPCLRGAGKGFDVIIASDAGKKFEVTRPDRAGFLRTAVRSSDILMDRVWQLEKEHFAGSRDYVFLPITDLVSSEDDPMAIHPELQVQVAKVRTDMDRFTDDEISGLTQHGYSVARKSISQRQCLENFYHDGKPWNPIANPNTTKEQASLQTKSWRGSHADDTTMTARNLRGSARRKIFGVMLNPRDWASYLYVPIILFLFGFVPYFVYGNWWHNHVASKLTSAVAESQHDYKMLLQLLEFGSVEAWQGMEFVEAEHLDPLFSEKGLDIISDSRITDLRSLEDVIDGNHDAAPMIYVYRHVSVRKLKHDNGETGLMLPSLGQYAEINVRCVNTELKPELRRCRVVADSDEKYNWQLKLDFSRIPVGHTTNVIVEALVPIDPNLVTRSGRPCWEFEVDADPEVAVSWLLLPDNWNLDDPRLVRFQNHSPDNLELVEPNRELSILGDSILNWVIVHPKGGYTYSYRWTSNPTISPTESVRQASLRSLIR